MLVFCERVDLEHGGVLGEEEVVQVHQDLSDAIDSEIRQYYITYVKSAKKKWEYKMIKQITIISVEIVSTVWIKFLHETSTKNYGRDNKFCQKYKYTDIF